MTDKTKKDEGQPVNASDLLNAQSTKASGSGTDAGSTTGHAAPSNPDKTPDDSGVSE